MDSSRPRGDALLVRGGRIEGVGSEDELRALLPRPDRVLDAGGRPLLPGFVDAHVHLVDGGLRLGSLDLSGADSRTSFTAALAERVRAVGSGWITGFGWDHHRWGGPLPDRGWIDEVVPDRPALLMRADLHMALANSRALELAGIEPSSREVEGGEIRRDGEGVPDGILVDRAIDLVTDHIPPPSPAELASALDRAQGHALSLGVTQLHDMGTIPPSNRDLELLLAAREGGGLRMRVHVATALAEWREAARRIEEVGRGDEWLWWGGVKGFVDGSLGAGTAWFEAPYRNRPGRGLTVTDPDELATDIRGADAAGLQPTVHAIGDAAVRWLTDIYASLPSTDGGRERRPRMEHVQHLPPGVEKRLARAGVVASVQPVHLTDDAPWMADALGEERSRRGYAFRTLREAGVPLAFGSDWTVVPLDPIPALVAAVTRRPRGADRSWNGSECIPLGAALRAHTAGAAWAGFSDRFSGVLKPGHVADFILLDGPLPGLDTVGIAGRGVGERVVTHTFVAGRNFYTREGW